VLGALPVDQIDLHDLAFVHVVRLGGRDKRIAAE